jgi:hypothetical protein
LSGRNDRAGNGGRSVHRGDSSGIPGIVNQGSGGVNEEYRTGNEKRKTEINDNSILHFSLHVFIPHSHSP